MSVAVITPNKMNMNNRNLAAWMLLPALLLVSSVLSAQYDDMYYDPDTDSGYYNSGSYNTSSNTNYDDEYYYDDDYSYDDEDYDYYGDEYYDYYYTSRIRRFDRPYYGFDYFDPVYVDAFYYDPFAFGGNTVLIYDSPWGFNRWNRWNRWNTWNRWNRWNFGYNPYAYNFGPSVAVGVGWNNWGWNSWGGGYGWNSWNRWNRWNNWGYGSNFYCPPGWGNNYVYNTVNVYNDNNVNNVAYGPRRFGSTVAARTNNRTTGLQAGRAICIAG